MSDLVNINDIPEDVELGEDQTYLRNKRIPRADAELEFDAKKIAEIKKSQNDLIYFAENYFYIVTLDDGKCKIDLYTPQRRVLKALVKNRFVVLCASRQVGKTTMFTVYALWVACFNPTKRIVIVANKEKTAIMILRRIKLAYEELPNWLKPGAAQWGNTEVIFGNKSSIAISTTTGSAVRGESVNVIIIDEMAHIDDHLIEDFWASVIPVISSSRKGTTKIFACSTPKGTGNKFFDIFTTAEVGESGDAGMTWHAEKIDYWEIPGRGKKWVRDMKAALGNDEQLFNQEFNNTFLETGESAVDNAVLDKLKMYSRPPMYSFEDGNYKVWKDPQPGHIYGIGVDVSEGIGRAASVAQVLDFTDLNNIELVASYHKTTIHPSHFAEVLSRIGNHWGKPPMLIERNNCGGEVITNLTEIHRYINVVSHNPDKSKYGDIRPGIYSHTNTKYNGVMNMRYWLNTLKVVNIYDKTTIQELQTFVRYPNGTWKAKQGNHMYDDRIMSLIWGLYILQEDICQRYYEIVATDDNGKPEKIRDYVISQPSMFKLDPFFQQDGDAPLPAIIGSSPTSGTFTEGNQSSEEFMQEGWRPWHQ
jgi:hypothetical protein